MVASSARVVITLPQLMVQFTSTCTNKKSPSMVRMHSLSVEGSVEASIAQKKRERRTLSRLVRIERIAHERIKNNIWHLARACICRDVC